MELPFGLMLGLPVVATGAGVTGDDIGDAVTGSAEGDDVTGAEEGAEDAGAMVGVDVTGAEEGAEEAAEEAGAVVGVDVIGAAEGDDEGLFDGTGGILGVKEGCLDGLEVDRLQVVSRFIRFAHPLVVALTHAVSNAS